MWFWHSRYHFQEGALISFGARLFFFSSDSSQHCIWSTHLVSHRSSSLVRQRAGKLGLVLVEIGHMKCHFNVEQIQWTGSYKKSFHKGNYSPILFTDLGPHHGNWTLFRLHQLAPNCYWFGFLVFSAKKATQEHKAGRFGWHRTAFSAGSRMKSTIIRHLKYFPYQTFPLVSSDNFTHVSPVCIIGELRNQEKMKTPEDIKVSREAEGYRWVQTGSEKATTSCLLWFLLKNHHSKEEWVFLG